MNWNQLKKELDFYLPYFMEEKGIGNFTNRRTGYKMMVGQLLPLGADSDFLYLDTGIILDPGDESYEVQVPEGFNYMRAEIFASGITENFTVIEAEEVITIEADFFDVVRVVLKFVKRHIGSLFNDGSLLNPLLNIPEGAI